MNRPPDWLIAFHEAAHAVTAERIHPGSAIGATIDGCYPGFEWTAGQTANTIQGQLVFADKGLHKPADLASLCYSGGMGEQFVPNLIDEGNPTTIGDMSIVEHLGLPTSTLKKAERRARKIVESNEREIRAVALALFERRTIDGDEIRKAMA